MTTTDVHGDVAERSVDRLVLASLDLNRGLRVPVVVDLAHTNAREDTVDRFGTLVKDGCDENGRPEEELTVGVGEGWVIGELPCKSTHDRASGGVGKVEEGVHVREELKSDVHGRLGSIGHTRPDISFLRSRLDDVVIPVEGEERRKLHPSVAEFLVRVSGESAGIDSKHGESEQSKL